MPEYKEIRILEMLEMVMIIDDDRWGEKDSAHLHNTSVTCDKTCASGKKWRKVEKGRELA
jgi:hypothetical protein